MNSEQPQPGQPSPRFSDAQLDAALASDTILPSSGFALSVMAAVRAEAAAPAPIPFPWKRALPGIAAIVAALGLLSVALFTLLRHLAAASPAPPPGLPVAHLLQSAAGGNLLPLVMAAFVALAALILCRRLLASG